MPGKTKNALVLFTVVSIALSVWIAILPSPRAYLLTRRAKRVMPLPFRNPQYQWLSDHELAMSALYPPQPLTHVDTRTGASVVWADFSRRVGNDAKGRGITISPDSKRALWMSNDTDALRTASLDASSITTRVRDNKEFPMIVSNPVWMSNSAQWVQILAGDKSLYAVVEGVACPGMLRNLPLGFPRGSLSGYDMTVIRLLGRTQSGRFLAMPDGNDWYFSKGAQRTLNFFDFSVTGGPARVHQYTIQVPKAGEFYDGDTLANGEEVRLSPRGDKLAWLLYVNEPEPPIRKWLVRWIPAMRTVPHPLIELRTSKLDGSEMKVIGYLEPDPTKNQLARKDPHGLRWLRNGQEVSFLYDGALWTGLTK